MYSWQFSKNFPLPKNGGHFEFSPKMAKHKIASISFTVSDRAISSKFSTHGVSKKCTLGNFHKIFPSPHMAAILNFRIFAQNEKTKICHRVTSLKFLTHRVSKKCTLGNFQKIFLFPKMAVILNFQFLPKIEKQKFASIFLTVQDRVISSKFSTQPMQKGMRLK